MVLAVEAQLPELKLNNDNTDADADHQPFCRWSLHRLDQCRFYDIQNRGHPYLMERGVKRYRWCWWDILQCVYGANSWLICAAGPAHAVYFGTYEAVKEFAGGNKDDGHHPFAAGIQISGYATTPPEASY
jgi:hypothetical protein